MIILNNIVERVEIGAQNVSEVKKKLFDGCRKGRKNKKRKKDGENITQDAPKIKHKKRRKQNLG